MFQADVDIELCYGHRLVGHSGKCRYLHGHSGLVTLSFESDVLKDGCNDMVIDFSEAKRRAKAWLDENVDHTLLLHEEDPIIPALVQGNERFLSLSQRPTAEVISEYIYKNLAQLGLNLKKVCLRETMHARATFWAGRP